MNRFPAWGVPVLLFVLLVLLFLSNHRLNARLNDAAGELAAERVNTQRVVKLKKQWDNPRLRQRLVDLLNQPALKDHLQNQKESGTAFRAVLKDLDRDGVDLLMKKLLEENYRIQSLTIERRGDNAADISLEVVF